MPETNDVLTVKHLNSKTGGRNPKEAVKTEKPIFMMRIYGIINSVKTFEDRNNDVKTAFLGDFRGVGHDGKQYESDKCYLFKSLEEKMVSVHKASGEKPVEFGYDISAVPDDKSNTGYVYQAKAILQTATSDRLAKLNETMSQHAIPGVPANEDKKEAAAVGKKK